MPTLKIEIESINSSTSTATYKKTGGPGQVDPAGNIDLRGQAATDIEWSITAQGYTFKTPGYSAPAIIEFDPPTNSNSDLTCTIDDTNADLGFKYTLYLKDGGGKDITLDPMVINR